MSTFVTRRAAFGIAATAALASLTACASDVRPLSDPSVLDAQRIYKGELKFNNYESQGTYVPATHEKKAENPRKPVRPANMSNKTKGGMYAALGYWMASQNYLMISGDIEPLKSVDATVDQYWEKMKKAYVKMYSDGSGWLYGTETPCLYQLTEESPQKIDEDRYHWKATTYMHSRAVVHTTAQGLEISLAYTNNPDGPSKIIFELVYQNGAWTVGPAGGSNATNSPQPTASSSSPA
ncbi:DUF6318 family protein [Rothia sp. HMSC061D12]|uniref:DUF6318 family protein n=1 Tax=Rothia sp. HMSC061D12 TaxID=1715161 RepID=UPI0008A91EEE|nr:DUF6318 family protein [Rothia sp. HMSC061D12]OHP57847.1 3-isopropylmalate dehydrogenase [Rothia sp. HMSC061D12]